MIKILHIISSLEYGGGVQMMLKNYYDNMPHNEYIFDFIVHGKQIGELEDYFASFGSMIYHVTPRRESFLKNHMEIKQIIKSGNYDIIHNHQDYHGAYSLKIAKKYDVNGRISHTHVSQKPKSLINTIIKKISVRSIIKTATDFFACSDDALKCMFGDDYIPSDFKIINNAIDFSRYEILLKKRNLMRKEIGIKDELVIGHIGRFVPVKNHIFILNLFFEFQKNNPNSKLVLVGDGPLMTEIRAKSVELGIDKNVIFLGKRKDIPEVLSVIDVLVLPSESEGLGMVAIEAQASGIKCICSLGVPKTANITGSVSYISTDDLHKWCTEIECVDLKMRYIDIYRLKSSGFDIKEESIKLMKYYNKIAKRD